MSDLRTAAQQALAFIRWLQFGECRTEGWDKPPPKAHEAEAALRSALAEPRPIHECYGDCPTNPQTCPNPCNFEGRPRPVQEPVAWRYVPSDVWGDAIVTQDPKTVELAQEYGRPVEPLYTAPPQRKPLTDEEIIDATEHIDTSRNGYFIDIARAVERAHGIGEQE